MVAAAAQTSGAKPEVEVLSYKWSSRVSKTDVGPAPSASPVQMGRSSISNKRERVSTRYYVYEIRLANNSSREIRAVAWDHIFTDPADGSELGRHSLFVFERIASGKTKSVEYNSPKRPVQVVTVGGLENANEKPFRESVALKCVVFADLTFLVVDGVQRSECERLRDDLINSNKK